MMQQEKRHSASWLSVLFLWLICGNLHSAAYANDTLTNAADVLALPAKAALAGIPVSVKGIVTAAETDWLGRFFVQDSSGGVFVDNRDNHPPVPGDVVEVSGISYPGGYAPVITKPHWKKLGTAPLPEAKPISTERLMSGMEDSQRVEVSGIVRSAEFSGSWIGIELVSGGYRFRAYFPNHIEYGSAVAGGRQSVVKRNSRRCIQRSLKTFVNGHDIFPAACRFHCQGTRPDQPVRRTGDSAQ